jgi:hypothetical protein
MSNQWGFKATILINFASHTRMRGMAFNVMLYARMVSLILSTSATTQHQNNTLQWACRHCMLELWLCLTHLKQSSIVLVSTTCTTLPSLQEQLTYIAKMKVCVSGVTRKGMSGLPDCVLRDEAKNKKMQMLVRGTVKAAVLKGDPNCPNLVATSVYDTKPVHFLSTSCDLIRWIIKTREVYCVDTNKLETIRFLRLNINDVYNAGMGHVDGSDQLRNYYRMDHWSRKQKWWWAIYMWGMGVMLVNSYVCYKSYHLENGTAKKKILSQFEFRRSIALAWMKPDEYWQTSRKENPKRK